MLTGYYRESATVPQWGVKNYCWILHNVVIQYRKILFILCFSRPQSDSGLAIRYCDLMSSFEQILMSKLGRPRKLSTNQPSQSLSIQAQLHKPFFKSETSRWVLNSQFHSICTVPSLENRINLGVLHYETRITIFTNRIFPPQNKRKLWNCAVPRQTKLLTPDWSHFDKFKQIFQMEPFWLS